MSWRLRQKEISTFPIWPQFAMLFVSSESGSHDREAIPLVRQPVTHSNQGWLGSEVPRRCPAPFPPAVQIRVYARFTPHTTISRTLS